MRILIVSATYIEAQRIIVDLKMNKVSEFLYSSEEYETDMLVTGIGSVATLFAMLTLRSLMSYDFIINIGIAGSFNSEDMFGKLVNVKSDYFGDVGLNTEKGFISVFETEFNKAYGNLINNGVIYNTSDFPAYFRQVSQCKGVSVGIPEKGLYPDADIETMEGAAFMLVCKHAKKIFLQLRSVSNIIGKTAREDWEVVTPINNYSNLVLEFIKRQKQ